MSMGGATREAACSRTFSSLRRDPFERASFNSNTYWDWIVDHAPQLYLVQGLVQDQIAEFISTRHAGETGVSPTF